MLNLSTIVVQFGADPVGAQCPRPGFLYCAVYLTCRIICNSRECHCTGILYRFNDLSLLTKYTPTVVRVVKMEV